VTRLTPNVRKLFHRNCQIVAIPSSNCIHNPYEAYTQQVVFHTLRDLNVPHRTAEAVSHRAGGKTPNRRLKKALAMV